MTSDTEAARRKLTTFLALGAAFSSIFYTLIIRAGTLNAAGGAYLQALMWAPGAAALLTRMIHQRNLGGEGWCWGKTRWQVIGYLLPLAYATAAYGVVWAIGLGTVGSLPAGLSQMFIIGTMNTVVFALGEELGWRGLLVPELAKLTDFTRVSLLSGILWAAWHMPIILFADYNSGTPAWFAIPCFSVMVIGLSFAAAWLRLRSGSIWPATLLHASHNFWIQGVFDAVTVNTGRTLWFTTEFGLGLAVAGTAIAVVFWRLKDQLPTAARAR